MKRWTMLLSALLALALCLPAFAADDAKQASDAEAAVQSAQQLTEEQLLSFYDGAVFIGDSVTNQLRVYTRETQVKNPAFLQNAKFMVVQSYMLYTASRKYLLSRHTNLTYKGETLPLWRVVEKMKPTRAIILLGLNDRIGEKVNKGVEYAERIIDLCLEGSPDTQLIFESLTPVTRSFCRQKDYRTLWDKYNEALKALCERRGVGYIDIASPLKDKDGYLPKEYASDGQCHLNTKGTQIWVDTLMQYAQTQYDLGLWKPEGIE